MESPAHPVEELGVTRLAQTCGHIFCRKELSGIITIHGQVRLRLTTSLLRSVSGDGCIKGYVAYHR